MVTRDDYGDFVLYFRFFFSFYFAKLKSLHLPSPYIRNQREKEKCKTNCSRMEHVLCCLVTCYWKTCVHNVECDVFVRINRLRCLFFSSCKFYFFLNIIRVCLCAILNGRVRCEIMACSPDIPANTTISALVDRFLEQYFYLAKQIVSFIQWKFLCIRSQLSVRYFWSEISFKFSVYFSFLCRSIQISCQTNIQMS